MNETVFKGSFINRAVGRAPCSPQQHLLSPALQWRVNTRLLPAAAKCAAFCRVPEQQCLVHLPVTESGSLRPKGDAPAELNQDGSFVTALFCSIKG